MSPPTCVDFLSSLPFKFEVQQMRQREIFRGHRPLLYDASLHKGARGKEI